MKVMTFNIRADSILDIGNRWAKRSSLVYDTIQTYDCEIVGLQEVTDKMYADFSKNIKSYNMIGVGRTKKYFNEKNSLLIKKDYHILEEDTFWLSKTPTKTGSSIWYSLFPRICTTAVIQLPNGFKIRVYNTHLDCLLPHAREYGLKKIIEYIESCHEKEQLPCILMGDFNATPNSKLIKKLAKGTYSSRRFIAVQDVNKEIYNKATMGRFRDKEKGMHIDYIFVSEDFQINNVDIIKYNQKGKYPSDHYPVIADLKI